MNLKTIKEIINTRDLPTSAGDLRVVGILDELSERFFPFECKFINLDYNHWEDQITKHNPHLLFVESIWNGYKKTWRKKLSPTNNSELIQLINWCKKRNIPTVFWNKEDPVHMFTFLGTANLFDFVFTTDLDCVPLYKRLLGHDRVGLLPFATAIQLFNPIEKYNRKEAACFAGSYYAKREERKEDFERIADNLIENYHLEIYDRNPYPGNPDYTFPKKYQASIKGTLPVGKIDIAYKSYKIGVTLNIVKHSSTMEARRVFELLGCNTLTITNPCLGIKNLFGDLVIQDDRNHLLQTRLKQILEDENYINRIRLLGLRKILIEHTYKQRVAYLYKKCFGVSPDSDEPIVSVFSYVVSLEDIEYIRSRFEKQTYAPKKLFLFTDNVDLLNNTGFDNVFPINEFHSTLTHQSDYYANFSTDNYYGKNYLLDLLLANRFVDVSAIGKSSYFEIDNGKRKFVSEFKPYQLIDQIQMDRSIFQSHLLPLLKGEMLISKYFLFTNVPCLSTDPYNFCANIRTTHLPEVDDLDIDTGISIEDLYKLSDSLSYKRNNYNLGLRLSGSELFNTATLFGSKLHFYSHPLNYLCFFTLDGQNQKLLINQKIDVTDLVKVDELSNKNILNVYINSTQSGRINFYLEFYSVEEKLKGQYLLHPNSCTTLPVPEDVEYSRLKIIAQNNSQCILKEIIVGPEITSPIDLSEGIKK